MNLQERTCLILFITFSITEASLYVTDIQMNKMIELTIRKPHCRIHADRSLIQQVVLSMDQLKVRQVPAETIQTLEKVCIEGSRVTSEIQGGLSFIYPGTLWCGPGTLARNYSDLGRHAEEDKCCRAHDSCFPQLKTGECLKSICNTQPITRLHCSCDDQFRRCLSSLNTDVSNILGAMFFNTVQVTCFDYRRPCSVHQRYFVFYFKYLKWWWFNIAKYSFKKNNLKYCLKFREKCDYAFYTQDSFSFDQENSLESLVTAEARVGTSNKLNMSEQRFFDPYTIQLILHAVYDNFIILPLRTLTNFYIVTKTIIFTPSLPIDEKYIIH